MACKRSSVQVRYPPLKVPLPLCKATFLSGVTPKHTGFRQNRSPTLFSSYGVDTLSKFLAAEPTLEYELEMTLRYRAMEGCLWHLVLALL